MWAYFDAARSYSRLLQATAVANAIRENEILFPWIKSVTCLLSCWWSERSRLSICGSSEWLRLIAPKPPDARRAALDLGCVRHRRGHRTLVVLLERKDLRPQFLFPGKARIARFGGPQHGDLPFGRHGRRLALGGDPQTPWRPRRPAQLPCWYGWPWSCLAVGSGSHCTICVICRLVGLHSNCRSGAHEDLLTFF